MTPDEHAKLSVRDFGGKEEDYIDIHKYLDQTKIHFADFKHRAILHNSMGMKICEDVFGDYITNSDLKDIPVREISRRHILQDCGTVPTIEQTIHALTTNTYQKFNNPKKEDLSWLKNHRPQKEQKLQKLPIL
jgi:hypothetical protein